MSEAMLKAEPKKVERFTIGKREKKTKINRYLKSLTVNADELVGSVTPGESAQSQCQTVTALNKDCEAVGSACSISHFLETTTLDLISQVKEK
jgi:hypothetical protein